MGDRSIQDKLTEGKNPRGIPAVKFIEDVENFLDKMKEHPVETIIGAYSELHSKYKLMETNQGKIKGSLKVKIPELEKALKAIKTLQKKMDEDEDFITQYGLADTVYAKARVECNGKVCMWLGANVMVEYEYEEASEFLTKNLGNAQTKLKATEEDLEFLRTQIITVEVNIARVFNFDLKRRKSEEKKDDK